MTWIRWCAVALAAGTSALVWWMRRHPPIFEVIPDIPDDEEEDPYP